MPAPTITNAPPAPLRSEDAATFNAKAEAFVDWLAGAPAEFNALGDYLEALESGTLSPLLAAYAAAAWSTGVQVPTLTALNTVVLRTIGQASGNLLDKAAGDALYAALSHNHDGSYQPLDSDLTAIAALTTAAFGRSLLTLADAAAGLAALGAKASAPNVQAVTSSATVTPTFSDDLVKITAQAAGLTLANWSGTAVPGWGMAIRIKDNGTARSIAYGSKYRAIGVTLPTTTVINKTLYLGCIYNSDDDKIDVLAVAQEA